MNQPIDGQDWEDQINALLDGDLDDEGAGRLKDAAASDHQLSQAIIEAYQLQRALANIPQQRAPDSLRRKLAAIPQQESRKRNRGNGWWRQPLQFPRWAAAVAVIPLVVFAVSQLRPADPSPAEIAQAQQELIVALSYLGKISRETGLEIGDTVNSEIQQTVNESVYETIHGQLEFNKERKL